MSQLILASEIREAEKKGLKWDCTEWVKAECEVCLDRGFTVDGEEKMECICQINNEFDLKSNEIQTTQKTFITDKQKTTG